MIASGRNASTHGLSKGEIKRVRSKINSSGMILDVEVFFPRLFIQAKYKGEGRYNDLVLNARGDITIQLCKHPFFLLRRELN